MVRKKIDNRIRVMIENGVVLGHRTMFVIVGDKGRDQVVILHHMLSKTAVRARPSVLWCYKKELGFTSHRKKRMKQLQKKIRHGKINVNEEDPFELFIASTDIRYCYYAETHKILGNTYGMCVLQDFEALTPNLLARTIETVEGGGIVVILLRTVASLKQLYTLSMDVHARYRTEAHRDVTCRFNERFLLSLASCKRCIVMDDQLNILPLSSHVLQVTPIPARPKEEACSEEEKQLRELKESLQDTQPVGTLVNNCCTVDQAKALLKFVEAISEKTLRSTVALTASRGRGKSAALGLAIASAVAFNYSNIFVTSPSPENLNTLFEFIFKGFDALEYQEHLDYEVVQSTNPEFNKAVIRVNIFRDHRQTIQYIHPSDAPKLGQCELLVIDEAAAIPLPLVRNLLGPYLVFMASTINGYEGTGRSLSLKLIQQLRQQMLTLGDRSKEGAAVANTATSTGDSKTSATGRTLHEVQLEESIRYKNGDDVEAWLNDLLCLNVSSISFLLTGCPLPKDCELYYINRDTLFSFHRASEAFLQRLMTLYVSSHYKNTPNDLQMMSDAPAHHLFCLLGPVSPQSTTLPEVLCVIQVCLEGEISRALVMRGLSKGKGASGDLIPWTMAQQFQDDNFPSLSGARVIRIATHPNYQRMGYGLQALKLLQAYYERKFLPVDDLPDPGDHDIDPVTEESVGLLEEKIVPRKSLPPLLLKLSERPAERLDYLGVSFGLTSELLRFWKKAGYVPVYLRQTENALTGEHSCIMLKVLNADDADNDTKWLDGFWQDFRRRFITLLGYQFSTFHPSTALSVLTNNVPNADVPSALSKVELDVHFTDYDLKRLDLYSNNMVDHHLITDLLPTLARLHFTVRLSGVDVGPLQAAILLGHGLQHKTVDSLAKELDLPATQLLGIFIRVVRRLSQRLNRIAEKDIESTLPALKSVSMEPTAISLADDLEDAENETRMQQKNARLTLEKEDLAQFAIKGSENDWKRVLETGGTAKSLISVKSEKRGVLEKRKRTESPATPRLGKVKKPKKRFKK